MQHQSTAGISKQHQITEARIVAVQRFDQDAIVVAQPWRHADTAYSEPYLHSAGQQILHDLGQQRVGRLGQHGTGGIRRHQAAAAGKSSSTELKSLAWGRKESSYAG